MFFDLLVMLVMMNSVKKYNLDDDEDIDVFITIISLIFQFLHLYRLHCFAYNTAWPINKPFNPSF